MYFGLGCFQAEIEGDNENLRQAEMFKQTQIKKYKSDLAVLLPKQSPYEYIILTEEEAGHFYTFLSMPI